MSENLHSVRFPGESEAYRSARNELLKAESDLRERVEAVAALRRKLPPGGAVKEDYVFEECAGGKAKQTRLSELFAPGKSSLFLYSFMYSPKMEQACSLCTSLLDSLNGTSDHASQRINFAVVAKSPIERLRTFAESRGWNRLRLLSSHGNTYNTDYAAESSDGNQIPMGTVFVKTPEGIRHFYSTELFYAPAPGQPRHMDLMWPLWAMFDLTPEGRGTDWYPALKY